MFDSIILDGAVLDGRGCPARRLDIGIRDGKIAALGNLSQAEAGTIYRAAGRMVTPGFLDIHRHGDLAVFQPAFGELELRQGLTTIINGNCGMSAAPFGAEHRGAILDYLSPVIGIDASVPSESVSDYLQAVRASRPPLHVGLLAGSGVIRADVSGFAAGTLTREQLHAVRLRLETALAEGALGVSLGLGYAPDCFYDTQGLIDALAPLRDGSVPLTVHIRDEGGNVDKSVTEMLTVARALNCPLEISHLKAIGMENWQRKIPRVLDTLARARAEGLRVRWDVYPYTAGSTQLLHVLPPEVLEGGTEVLTRRLSDPAVRAHIRARLAAGEDYNNIAKLVGWENVIVSSLHRPENRDVLGLSIPEAAALRGLDEVDFTLELLRSERCAVTMIDFITCEEDLQAILRSDAVSLISDATYPATGKPHPRLYGSFVRLIERYVNQLHVLTLPEAVRKMTLAPAEALGLGQKGRIALGADADLLIFNPAALHEAGSYEDPARFAQGIDDVFVAGAAVLLDGKLTGKRPGHVVSR
jgi:N-acyl-D-aspartate/D-glutamate deacylase